MEQIFSMASRAWNAMDSFRAKRLRCKRFVYGDQFGDLVEYEGRRMTERQYIEEMGQTPMKNNILRRILRNVVGVYRSDYKVPVAKREDYGSIGGSELKSINKRRKEVFRSNSMESLLPRILEEFLISGMSVVKIEKGDKVRILPVTPDNFFFHSDGYDPRGWNADMLGEIHNVSYSSLMGSLCRNAEDFRRLESIFGDYRCGGRPCRVMEIWYRDSELWGICHDRKKARMVRKPVRLLYEDALRRGDSKDMSDVKIQYMAGWRCGWFAADGTLLKIEEGLHESQPYIWKAYPFIDGEIHSYVSDMIDQQKYVNHLITLYDFIMKSSAKGVLLFPDESLPRGMNLQDVADEWSRFNGVIPYRAQPGVPLPTQVSGNSANIGITELLKIEMQMLEDISGVSPTLQGKLETTTASGTLFAQQNQAALTSLLDVVHSFKEFVADIADSI